ncbi:ribose-phosphate pyrophosphokinase [Ethanoligenens sp.]|uniref:ribose-phosphate pyrophosphokinase n=1 Tax=Ethanoligenens sp. TaxID=2099655 RepID=UPI0039ED9861
MNLHGKDIRIFSANANPGVAEGISTALGLPLGHAEVGEFSDGESSVSIFESVRGSDVFVVQSTCAPVNDHLMELLIMLDALKRASAGRITAVMPYFGYARQDRKAKARDPISAKLVADLIIAAGADRLLTMDLHAPQIQGFFDIPVDHLLGVPVLAPHFQQKFAHCLDEICVMSPDLGSVTRARNFADRIDAPLAIVDKRRPKANECQVMHIIGDVRDKRVIIVDDMVDTAGTLVNAAKAAVEIGGAKEVYACATHGVLSGPAMERLENSYIKELVLLDTVPVPMEKRGTRVVMLPCAPVFAKAVERIYSDKSVSMLFV